jgi:endonuclease/exonuclease/phosphatase family metal-dependent hydrolase
MIVFLACLGGCRASDSIPAPKPAGALRIMSYNIHHAETDESKCDPATVAKVINAQQPDVVVVQEVDVRTQRVDGVDLAIELSRLTKMHVVFGKAIDYQGGEYGQAILSRFPIESSRVHPLPGRSDAETRIALAARIRLDDKREIQLIGTHLDHIGNETDRLSQANTLIELFGKDDGVPTILAGDFNSVPTSKTQQIIQSVFHNTSADNAPTHPAPNPRRKIDYIFIREPDKWIVNDSFVLHIDGVSDHCPIVADVVLKK